MQKTNNVKSSEEMTKMQKAVYEVECFLGENYSFRRNVLSNKVEVHPISGDASEWMPVSEAMMNSIVREAKLAGIGGDQSPRKNIEEYVLSQAIPTYDPIGDFLQDLPQWDGKNHVSALFSRIPGLTSEQLAWMATWLRSTVAHWMGLDMQHGNESVPILIGEQGCGKSTFAVRLLPEHLRCYYLDHINFGNKFDSDMALTSNLLVNIDEFANMGPSQQGKLKQTLSRVKVNGRPIFGRAQEDRRRYASFLATTNNEHPLCDPTGSRRYLCIRVAKGCLIDNETDINYPQLYAQVKYELEVKKTPYWFTNDEVLRIQQANLPYFKTDDMESILGTCYRLPQKGEEGEWIPCSEILRTLQSQYPMLAVYENAKIRIGQTLKYLGVQAKHTKTGQKYLLQAIA